MSNYHAETKVSGDPELHASVGTADIEVDYKTGEVSIGLPDRFGHSTTYNFARHDWDRIVKMIDKAELRRGKVVSVKWAGQR